MVVNHCSKRIFLSEVLILFTDFENIVEGFKKTEDDGVISVCRLQEAAEQGQPVHVGKDHDRRGGHEAGQRVPGHGESNRRLQRDG